jgi:cell division septation protein DedD
VAATPRGAGGGFAVQLAAPGSEAEARITISRIQQRYGSALGGRQPTVRKATVGERDVYRVRVVGLSQTDANGLCERLKSSGGSCFVARE